MWTRVLQTVECSFWLSDIMTVADILIGGASIASARDNHPDTIAKRS